MAAVFANGNPGKAIKLATSEDFKELKQQVVGTLLSLEKGGMDIITQRVKEAGSFKNQIDDYFRANANVVQGCTFVQGYGRYGKTYFSG